jgi:hypothetical protein
MATTEETLTWRGMDLRDRDGDKIGTIDEIYEDTDTGKPEWALVHTGLFGTKRTFVPLREASMQGDGVTVPYEKSHVKDAPGIDPDGALSREEEQALYQHYSLSYSTSRSDSGGQLRDARVLRRRHEPWQLRRRAPGGQRRLGPGDRQRHDALRGGARCRHDARGSR